MAQYAAKNAWAVATSAVCDSQADLTDRLILWLTTKEFCCFWHAHDAKAVGSAGHCVYVRPMTMYDSWLAIQFGRYSSSGMSVMYWLTGMLGVGKVGRAPWLQYALSTVDAEA